MRLIQHPFVKVETYRGMAFGGNQAWFPYKFLKKYGCGVIGAADVFLCIKGKSELSQAEFIDFACDLWKYYLPVIPGFGMNGLTLMHGMNRYFRKNGMNYRACWKLSGKKLMRRIDEMLQCGIPVILSVGPNFPVFWGKERVKLYTKSLQGEFLPVTKTKAHYMVVTGSSELWLQVSSWGKQYYINKMEYAEYVKNFSSYWVSNIICIRKIKEIE